MSLLWNRQKRIVGTSDLRHIQRRRRRVPTRHGLRLRQLWRQR